METLVSQEELLGAAYAGGFEPVSASQLKRLRRARLLQQPRQYHAIGKPGSTTLYPPQAVPQLLGILHIRKYRRQRPFEAVAFLAWEDGLWVEPAALRRVLAGWIRQSAKVVQRLGVGEQAEERAGSRALDIAEGETRHPMASEVLGRVGDSIHKSDIAFAIIQQAERLDNAHLSADIMDQATGFEAFAGAHGQPAALVDVYSHFDPPPASMWPRIVSRSSRTSIAIGLAYLNLYKGLTAKQVLPDQPLLRSDEDDGIRQRAIISAPAIVLGSPFAQRLVESMNATDP